MKTLTAKYIKISSGYMGQILEWPEVVTEGKDLETCRESLRDTVEQKALAYRGMGKELPEFIVDEKNNKRAVILPFDEWKTILEDLEELEDIRAYDSAKHFKQESVPFEEAVRKL